MLSTLTFSFKGINLGCRVMATSTGEKASPSTGVQAAVRETVRSGRLLWLGDLVCLQIMDVLR